MPKLTIIVPCYNEEEVLRDSAAQLLDQLNKMIALHKIDEDSSILFVNDGSRDSTWKIITELVDGDKHFEGLNLAGNVGHQNALLAGVNTVCESCDISITIDADLQDDIAVMEQMVDYYQNDGADIVYGVRNDRTTDSFFKRFTAQSFYKMMSLLGVKTVYNHADYRLMSRRAMKQLCLYKERNMFLRGIVPKIGYKTASVYYARKERMAGESKYPLKKMISFAWDGITSLSIRPISFIVGLGVGIMALSVIAFICLLILLCVGHTVSIGMTLMASVWFLGGVQLLAIGIVGQYVGKTYVESKERPRYNIEEHLTHDEK